MRVFHTLIPFSSALLSIWLSGSLLLPFMLLLRWGGSRWRRLGWLTRTKRRWLLIWGCYGLVKALVFAALFWVVYSPEFLGGFDALGWEGQVVWRCIRALHIQRGEFLIEFVFGFSLMAIVDAAMCCGFAAVVWWVFRLFATEAGTRPRIVPIERYGLSMLLSACALGIANNLNLWRTTNCDDCFLPYGIPFTLYHEGGFAGIRKYVWTGIIGDILVVLAVGLAIGLVWNKLARKYSSLHIQTG
jgi:hypothetical protein